MTRITLLLLGCLLTPLAVAVQTCTPTSIAATTPTAAFTDHADGTLTDERTGLMWRRCSEGQAWDGTTCTGMATALTWQQALQAPALLNGAGGYAGHTDWRLPNIKELRTIVERQCTAPAINLTLFPNTGPNVYWSGSPLAGFPASAWSVDFGYGNDLANARYFTLQVRLVRGGQ